MNDLPYPPTLCVRADVHLDEIVLPTATLSTEPLLQPFELELVCFNPKLVAKFKDGLVLRSPKNDDRDVVWRFLQKNCDAVLGPTAPR